MSEGGREPGAVRTVAEFEVRYEQVLDADGNPAGELVEPMRDVQLLRRLYRAMLLTRSFDAKAVALQRTGRLGTFASSLGQEALGVGIGAAMHDDDVFLPSFREHGAQLWRGVSLTELLLFWGGDERGNDFAVPREDFPACIPIAGQCLHAAGVALAFQLRGQARAAVCVVGDGGTSKGDFYEALNLAGTWSLPCVFVIANNQWAISMPREQQTAAATLAQKAIAAGIEGTQVDGNDVLGVMHVVSEAVARARSGGGPAVVEALTYRLADHTTVDDASRYRDEHEVEAHWPQEPLRRLRAHLERAHGWSEADDEALRAEVEAEVETGAERYLATPPAAPEAMFDYLYAELPAAFAAQREQVVAGHRGPAREGNG